MLCLLTLSSSALTLPPHLALSITRCKYDILPWMDVFFFFFSDVRTNASTSFVCIVGHSVFYMSVVKLLNYDMGL